MNVLITRPQEDAEPLAAELAARGIDSVIAPLLEIEYLSAPLSDFKGVQAVLITSANGIRALARRGQQRDVSVLTVGDASADAARALGFSEVQSADGDVDALAALVKRVCTPQGGKLLHVAGTRLAGDLGAQLEQSGFSYERVVLYAAHKATHLAPHVKDAILAGELDGVLLYSPRTAKAFVALCRQAGVEAALAQMDVYCLSPAVAREVAGVAFRAVRVAENPNQAALLAVVGAC